MKPGATYHWISEESRGETTSEGKVRFANNPLTSGNTQLISAALVSGFRLMEPSGYRDTVEQSPDGPIRRVEWVIDGATRGNFKTRPLGDEEIEFPEFKRRYESEEWCLAHSDHPIAFLKWAFRSHGELRNRIRELKPATLIRRGNQQVTLPHNINPQKREKLLSFLK